MFLQQKNKTTTTNEVPPVPPATTNEVPPTTTNEVPPVPPVPPTNESPPSSTNELPPTNESINLLPNIKITDNYIEFYINYSNQPELPKFYDENYWNLIGLTPEITIQDQPTIHNQPNQRGGENTNDSLTLPYKYFHYILKNNPISLLLKKRNESSSPSFLKSFGFKKTEKEEKPYNYDSDPLHIPNALSMNPTKIKETTGSLISPTHAFDINPEEISNDYHDKTTQSILIIKFTSNKGIISLENLMKTRDPNIDIDITESKFKYKELEKIKIIKEKKEISEDIYLEEIYYINEKLVILKGILNDNYSTKTIIDLSTNLSFFENAKYN